MMMIMMTMSIVMQEVIALLDTLSEKIATNKKRRVHERVQIFSKLQSLNLIYSRIPHLTADCSDLYRLSPPCYLWPASQVLTPCDAVSNNRRTIKYLTIFSVTANTTS